MDPVLTSDVITTRGGSKSVETMVVYILLIDQKKTKIFYSNELYLISKIKQYKKLVENLRKENDRLQMIIANTDNSIFFSLLTQHFISEILKLTEHLNVLGEQKEYFENKYNKYETIKELNDQGFSFGTFYL